MSMEIFFLPALIAVALKIGIFIRYGESLLHDNINLALFFFAALLLNVIELFAFESQYQGNTMLAILLAYYCAAVFLVHSYLNLTLQLSGMNWHLPQVKKALNILLALLIVNIVFNRHVIAGAEVTDITFTRIPGVGFIFLQSYLTIGMALGLALLAMGYKKLSSNHGRQRCFVMLLSTLPPILVSFAIFAGMAFGSTITAALFMPVALTIMLGLIIYAEEKTRLFKLLSLVPYSRERKLHQQVLNKLTQCIAISDHPKNSENSLNLKQVMREFEGHVVAHTVGYYSGNQKMAAHALGVSEATVSRRARAVHSK